MTDEQYYFYIKRLLKFKKYALQNIQNVQKAEEENISILKYAETNVEQEKYEISAEINDVVSDVILSNSETLIDTLIVSADISSDVIDSLNNNDITENISAVNISSEEISDSISLDLIENTISVDIYTDNDMKNFQTTNKKKFNKQRNQNNKGKYHDK